jgi:hypothetical protein
MKRKMFELLSGLLFWLGKLFDVPTARPEHFLIGGPRLGRIQYLRCDLAALCYDRSASTYFNHVMTQQMRDELDAKMEQWTKETFSSQGPA